MSSASPDTVMRQWFQEVWNERREDAIDRLMASDAQVHGLAPSAIAGPEGFKPFHRAMCGAFAFRVEVVQTVVEGDRVAAHCHVVGRHVGDALGGKRRDDPSISGAPQSATSATGASSKGWNTFDFLTMYQRIGWVTSPVVG